MVALWTLGVLGTGGLGLLGWISAAFISEFSSYEETFRLQGLRQLLPDYHWGP